MSVTLSYYIKDNTGRNSPEKHGKWKSSEKFLTVRPLNCKDKNLVVKSNQWNPEVLETSIGMLFNPSESILL